LSGSIDDEKRKAAGAETEAFFQALWMQGDYWDLESSDYERRRLAALVAMVDDRRYRRVLEVGCGAGELSRLLAPLAEEVVGLDVAAAALERGRERGHDLGSVRFVQANIMEYDLRAERPWDLVVISETIYYLGWLYSFFDIAWLASELLAATRPGARLLLADTQAVIEADPLVRPWIIRTYHDLFANVGFELEDERVFRGVKDGQELEVLESLFFRP
jgi:SAM-dependent methyltransferase